jgi:tetratricopeptide (TPR) repeat protein
MSRSRSITAALAGAAALLGCAAVPPQPPPAVAGPFVAPLQAVRHGMDAEAHYRTGRYFQGQARLDLAADAYRRALVEQPSHVEALNAMGIVHSLQQRPELAERSFRLALQAEPLAAHVHNNLGYHLLRNGRGAEAIMALERARELDPGNAQTRTNLAGARAQMALPAEPATAAAAPEPQTLAPVTVAPAAPVADLRAAPAGAVPVALDQVAEGVWRLGSARAATAAPAPRMNAAPTAPVTALMGAAAPAMRVEVSNGHGANGLARQVAGVLASASALSPRLTNDKPFGVQVSRIQYVAGAERLAEDINARLPTRLPLARTEVLARDVRVRVLLGKDFPQGASIAEISTRSNS